MSLIKSILYKLYKKLDKSFNEIEPEPADLSLAGSSQRNLGFNIYIAKGGIIVESLRYDTKKHEEISCLHIVNSESDLGEAIGKIITMEFLK
jgi:hypothetical protein